ncbi:MAG: alanine racemase [Acidobacteriota bacterium]
MGSFDARLDEAGVQRLALDLADVPTPALILDLDVLERNLATMASRATERGIGLRPHYKTHQSPVIARWQRDAGAVGHTVATLQEASTLLAEGFTDLTWAFPLILNRTGEVVALMRQYPDATLRLLVDSADAVTAIENEVGPKVGRPVHVWLEVDVGQHRSGVDPAGGTATELARRLNDVSGIVFDGLLCHSGHAYRTPGRTALAATSEGERHTIVELAERFAAAGLDGLARSIGSTPAMSAVGSLDGITEARPGNYVFYDHTQVALGACAVTDCALTVVASVISSQPGAEYCVVDAGALALSKDPGPSWVTPTTFGEIFADYRAGALDPEIRLTGLSQEHGVVSAPLPVGTRLRILPNHSCLVVPYFESYVAVRGDRVIARIPIRHRRH